MVMNKIAKLEKMFGSVKFENEKYILINDVELDEDRFGNLYYFANAIKADDAKENAEFVDMYYVEWYLSEKQAKEISETEVCDMYLYVAFDSPNNVRKTYASFDIKEDGRWNL